MKGCFKAGLAYVGFSTVKTLEGLHILNYDLTQIKVDPSVESYMNLVKTNSIPSLPKSLTESPAEGSFDLALQNVQNLYSHRKDVMFDESFIKADILCMTETHLKDTDPWPLTEKLPSCKFNISRCECVEMKGGGICICSKKTLGNQIVRGMSNTAEFLHVRWKDSIEIVCAYKRPQKSLAAFICELEPILKILLGKRSIICGDFNVDLLTDNDNRDKISEVMAKYGFVQTVKEPTTDGGTLLDHIYVSKLEVNSVQVMDTYYSYHDKVNISFKY